MASLWEQTRLAMWGLAHLQHSPADFRQCLKPCLSAFPSWELEVTFPCQRDDRVVVCLFVVFVFASPPPFENTAFPLLS